MTSEKRLSSVCHSIAHHAVSALSYLHPHLRQACRAAGEYSAQIDLLSPNPCPENLRGNQPLQIALMSLQERFAQILQSEGFSLDELQKALLFFEFPAEYKDDYCSNCHAALQASSGKEFLHAVNCMGASIVPNPSFKRDCRKSAAAP